MKTIRMQQKGERRISAALRLAFAALALLLQVAFVVLLAHFLQEYMAVVYAVLEIAALVVAIRIFNSGDDSMHKLTWIILLLAMPVVGFILYAFWSGDTQRRRLAKNAPVASEKPESVRARSEMSEDKLRSTLPGWARLSAYLRRQGFLLYQNTRVTYFPEGERMLRDMLEQIRRAEHFVFLEYFILAEGRIWDELCAVLCEKARGGVEVQIIFDDFGNIRRFSGETIERLRASGVEVYIFNPVQKYVNRL